MPLVDAKTVRCASPSHLTEYVYKSTFTKVADSIFSSVPCPSCGSVEFFQFSDNGADAQVLIAQVAAPLGVAEAQVDPIPEGP